MELGATTNGYYDPSPRAAGLSLLLLPLLVTANGRVLFLDRGCVIKTMPVRNVLSPLNEVSKEEPPQEKNFIKLLLKVALVSRMIEVPSVGNNNIIIAYRHTVEHQQQNDLARHCIQR